MAIRRVSAARRRVSAARRRVSADYRRGGGGGKGSGATYTTWRKGADGKLVPVARVRNSSGKWVDAKNQKVNASKNKVKKPTPRKVQKWL